jgi:DNA-binding response OmpR family regulator
MPPRILIVDDDSSIRTLLSVVATRAGVEADVAVDGAEAMAKIAGTPYDLVVLDLQMPRMNGFDLVRELRGMDPRPAVIVLTALPATHHVILDPSVVHCIVRKPFDLGTFMALFVATATDVCASRDAANVIPFRATSADERR